MYCVISGKVPRVPVVSLVSRCIFEKSLLEEYVKVHGKDPVNNKPMSAEQIVPINVDGESLKYVNSANSATLNTNYSIPSLLSTLQNEWDAVMLENFELRKNADQLVKKLSTALYERDAAKKVALRAVSEQRRLQKELDEVVQQIVAGAEEQDSGNDRKRRKVLAVVDSNFSDDILKSSIEYLQATKPLLKQSSIKNSVKNVVVKDISQAEEPKISYVSLLNNDKLKSVATHSSAEDTNCVCIYDGSGHRQVKELQGQEETVDFVVPTTSNNFVLKLQNGKLAFFDAEADSFQNVSLDLNQEIIYLYMHESVRPDLCLWADAAGNIGYVSPDGKQDIRVKSIEGNESKYTSADLHKDGILLALGNEKSVEIFNLSQPEEKPIVFDLGTQIPSGEQITAFKFCPNGFFFAIEVDNKDLYTFDLRKPQKDAAAEVLDVENKKWDFDITGKYLLLAHALNGTDIQVFFLQYVKSSKKWNTTNTHTAKLDEPIEGPIANVNLLSKGNVSSIVLSKGSKIVELSIEL